MGKRSRRWRLPNGRYLSGAGQQRESEGIKVSTAPLRPLLRARARGVQELTAIAFEGPFGLLRPPLLFEHPIAREPGIYLWAIPYRPGGHLAIYVGETSVGFGTRMKDHIIQTLGGNYRICDADLLENGQAKVLWNGLWRRGTRDKLLEYVNHAERLVGCARRELAVTQVFVAPAVLETRLRRRIEGALARHIRNQPPPISALLPADIRYSRRRPSEPVVRVEISGAESVHGLPATLEA